MQPLYIFIKELISISFLQILYLFLHIPQVLVRTVCFIWSSKKIIITLNIHPSITYTYEVVVIFNKKEQIIHIKALNKL